MPVTQAQKTARKIVRDRIGSVLNFHGRPVAYTVMDGIDDIVDDALEAAERARPTPPKSATKADWQPIETAPKDGEIKKHSFERQLWALRDAGWAVAIHNDYWLNGTRRTFWLFTHRSGKWIKGEGNTDMDALMECDVQMRDLQPLPSPPESK